MSAARVARVRMKAGGADVRVLHQPDPDPAENIVLQLRTMASNIESGATAAVRSVIAVVEFDADNNVQVFGWGDLDHTEAVGLLTLGTAKVVRDRLAAFEDVHDIGTSL